MKTFENLVLRSLLYIIYLIETDNGKNAPEVAVKMMDGAKEILLKDMTEYQDK